MTNSNRHISLKDILNEDPDTLMTQHKYNNRINFYDWWEDANVVFGYYKNKMIIHVGYKKHSELIQNKTRKDFKYPGRLFVKPKVITFWDYPKTKSEMNRVIRDLNNELTDVKIDDKWTIELPIPDDEYYKLNTRIPVDDYNGINKSDYEIDSGKEHQLSPMLKKKKQVPSGIGSKKDFPDRKPGETMAAYRAGTQQESKEIDEGKQVGIIYHFTDVESLDFIMATNSLKASTTPQRRIGTNEYNVFSVSFTRNKLLPYGETVPHGFGVLYFEVRIVVDGEKLSNKYKVEPFNYYRKKTRYPSHLGYTEYEERVIFPDGRPKVIANFESYVISYDILLDGIEESLRTQELYDKFINKYLLFLEINRNNPKFKYYYNRKELSYDEAVEKLMERSKKVAVTESLGKITYSNEVVDAYSGQMNCEAAVFLDGNIVGLVEYVLYNHQMTISMIQVIDKYRRQGFASRLLKYIQQENPGYKYKSSFRTDLGSKLKYKTDISLYEEKQMDKSKEFDEMLKKQGWVYNSHNFRYGY